MGWAAALLGLVVVAFFGPLVFGGQTFVSPDVTNPLGFVRVGEHSLYQDKVYPLWNPYVFLGLPSFASLAYNPLIYPPDWPVALLQKLLPLPEMTWMLLYYVLAGWFTFALAREWGARPEAALVAGFAFALTPNLVAVGAHGHGSQLVDSAYIPLMLWLAARHMKRGGFQHIGWLGLAGGLQLLRGHFQIAYYTWLAVGAYVLVETLLSAREPKAALRTLGRAAGVVGGLALGLLLASFLFLPLREYNVHSIRGGGAGGGVGMAYATSWSMGLREVWSFVVPNAVGFGGYTYWGEMPFTDYPHYVGVVTAVLVVFGFFSNGAPRLFALGIALFALLVALGKHFPLYQLLYDFLPYFKNFRIPVMILVLFQLAAALGAAWGWSQWLEAPRGIAGRERRVALVLAVLLGISGVVALLAPDLLRGAYVGAAESVLRMRLGGQAPPEAIVQLAAQAFAATVGDLAKGALLGLLTLGAGWAVTRVMLGAIPASAIVAVLLLVDLWPVSARVMAPTLGPVVRRDAESERDDVVRFLEGAADTSLFRVMHLPIQVADPEGSRMSGFRIASLTGYHAAKPKRFQDVLEAGLLQDPRFLGLLNVRYLITVEPLAETPPFLREVFRGSQVIYENLLALPRAMLLTGWRVVPDSAALAVLGDPLHDPSRVTLLPREPGVPSAPGDAAAGSVRVTAYRLHEVDLEVETPVPGVLRLADMDYPGWSAEVNERPAEVLRADYLLRAVSVPAGKSRVRFVYRSASLRTGAWISAAALLVCLGLIVGGRLARPRTAAV
jgi:hypothetical protein